MPVKRIYRTTNNKKMMEKARFVPPYRQKTPSYSITRYTHDLKRALDNEDTAELGRVMDRWKHIYNQRAYWGYKNADTKTKKKIMYLMIKNNRELVSPELYEKAKKFVAHEIDGREEDEEQENKTEETDNEI